MIVLIDVFKNTNKYKHFFLKMIYFLLNESWKMQQLQSWYNTST